jgi:hypothetical protein
MEVYCSQGRRIEHKGTVWFYLALVFKHHKWGGHKESDCRGVGAFTQKGENVAYPATNGSDDASTAAPTVTTPSVQVNKAYMSLSESIAIRRIGPLLRRLGEQYGNIVIYTVLYHVLMLVLQKIGNNIQLGLHMFLYTTFCLPLVLVYVHDPMKTQKNPSVRLRRNKKWFSFNVDWYIVLARI